MKKVVFFTGIMVLFSFIAGCSPEKSEPSRPISDTISSDEYSVYRDLMAQEFQDKGDIIVKEKTLIPINPSGFDSTVRLQMTKEFGKPLEESLISRFIRVNSKQAAIDQDMLGYKAATVLTGDAEKEMFTNDQIYYEDFRVKYPSPARMVEFSRVAFDYKMTRAIVYFGKIFYSGKSSSGHYLFLKKANGKWVIDKKLAAWSL